MPSRVGLKIRSPCRARAATVRSIGFVTKSFMPASSACSRSDTRAAAVSAMIGSSLSRVALAQDACRLVAPHPGHLQVHQHRVVGLASCRGAVDRLDGLLPVAAPGRPARPTARVGPRRSSCSPGCPRPSARARRAKALRPARRVPRLRGRRQRGGQRQFDPEAAASARVRSARRLRRPSDAPARGRSTDPGRCRRSAAWSKRRPARRAGRGAAALLRRCPARYRPTARTHAPAARRAQAPIRTLPDSVNLIALARKLTRIWRVRTGSPSTTSGASSAIASVSVSPLGCASAR